MEEFASKYDFLIKNIDKTLDFKYILNTSKIKLNQDATKFINFQNTAIYSPTCYLTQVPGMYIAKNLNSNPFWIFYLGRISNLLFFTIIIYFAIRIIPFYKLPLVLLTLAPMTLSLASSLTSDVIVIGLNFLWVAILMRLIFDKKKINNFQIGFMILLAVILALSKCYFMLIPLIFLLPKSKFKNCTKYIICTMGVLIFAIVGILFWQNIVNGLSFDMSPQANALRQMQFIVSNPITYAMVVLKTMVVKMPRIIITMIGVLGWQDTRLDFMTYILYPILIVLSILREPKIDFKFQKWQVYLIGLDIVISICLIFTSMYLMWSEVASPIIFGLNGKYFTPIMLPFLLLFYGFRKNQWTENVNLFIYLAIILILISSDLSLLHRFYSLTPNLYYKV